MAEHCRIGLIGVTEQYQDPQRRTEIAAMISAGNEPRAVIEEVTRLLEPADGQILRAEFLELPISFTHAFMMSWVEAAENDLDFSIESVSPTQGLDMARNGRVTWTVEADSDGIRMGVSHMPNHHAAWMSEKAAVAGD